MMLTLEELYKQDEYSHYAGDFPRTYLVDPKYHGHDLRNGAIASLSDWHRNGELYITRKYIEQAGFDSLTIGDEIEIDGVRLLAIDSDLASWQWVFLDASQPESHRWLMHKLAQWGELKCQFTLLGMMEREAEALHPENYAAWLYGWAKLSL